jgi:hypothetical protein
MGKCKESSKGKLNKKQQEKFDMLMSKGGRHFPEDGLPNIVWVLGRCIHINKDGSLEDL